MDYRDSIKNIQKLNRAYDAVCSTTEGFETATNLSRQFIQMPYITELTSGITSSVDTLSQTFNHVTALESSMEQMSKLTETARILTEINASQNNSIINLISETSPILADLQPVLPTIRGLIDTLTDTRLYQMINGIETIVSTINNINYQKMFDKISFLNETLETVAQNMVRGIDWVSQINFDNIANSLVQPEMLEKTIWEYEQSTGVESAASNEEITELHNDLQDIAADNKNWQQNFAEKINKWKEKNPVIFFLIVQILTVLLSILSNFIFGKITAPKAVIKEEPNAAGDVIYNITINQDVTIIDDTRYYYKVKFYNIETDTTITGWISKRSLEISDGINLFED